MGQIDNTLTERTNLPASTAGCLLGWLTKPNDKLLGLLLVDGVPADHGHHDLCRYQSVIAQGREVVVAEATLLFSLRRVANLAGRELFVLVRHHRDAVTRQRSYPGPSAMPST